MAELVENKITEADKIHLVELVEGLRRSNGLLRAETDLFDRYIGRLDPRDLVTLETLGATSHLEMSMGRGRKPKVRTLGQERSQQLTLDQKCEVAHRELDEMREDLKKVREGSERELQNYRATLEEAEIRLVEVKKASYSFDRDVAKNLREKKGLMTGPEKVIRYLEEGMRHKHSLTEKLRLKNGALRAQRRSLQQQLRQREEVDEALREVDFQQLKIENSQHLERIDERNRDLLHLKLLAGNSLLVLSSYKKKLQSSTSESVQLSRDFASRKQMLMKIEEETGQAEDERAKAEALNRKLRGQLVDYRVPDVMAYVSAEASHRQLQQSVHAWERKVEIAEMALKTHTKAWNTRRAAAQAGPVHKP